tara:strand:- start:1598 stop:2011 length:414 start_codon:yes stop_codon:yes gene_type:complete
MIIDKNNYPEEVISATTLLLSITKVDDNIDNIEITMVKDIIEDFFEISSKEIPTIIQIGFNNLEKSTDLYEFGKTLNNNFTYQDKIDFICCAFEVAYADKNLHYLEEHLIKKISFILSVEHEDLIASKNEIKNYLIN